MRNVKGSMGCMNSVGARLLAVILSMAVPLGALIAYQVYETAMESRRAAVERLRQVTREISDEVRQLHRHSDWLLAALAALPAARELDPGMCRAEMEALRRVRREFVNVTLWDGRRRAVCSDLPLPDDATLFPARMFHHAVTASSTYVGDVFMGRMSRQPVVLLTHPVRDDEGHVVGLVALTVGLRYIEDRLRELDLPAGFAAGIADRAGTYIARTPHGEAFRGKPVPPGKLLDAVHRPGEGELQAPGVDGVARTYVFETVHETGWKVFAGIEPSKLFEAHWQRMARSALVTLAVVLASLYLAFQIGRSIRRPLRSLSAAAAAVAKGDPGARARVAGSGEIAGVVAQFDRMLDALAEKDSSLREANLRLQHLSSRLLREVEEERGHIARELHDHVGQSLTALEMDLKRMHRHASQPEELVRVERCLETVSELLEQVRGLALDLRPSQLDDLGLVAALRAQVDRYFDVARVRVHLEAEDLAARLTRDLETAVFRICQEALTNVLRHARARNVWITLRAAGDSLLLNVRDDGGGFDPAAALEAGTAGRSSGLRNMMDRAGLAGGTLAVRATPGAGTEIEARLPL